MPKKKGTMVLVWLIRMVSFSFLRTSPKSSSIPMANMKRINPNWLNILMLLKEATGKIKAEISGNKFPKTEGPSTIPATISPITVGCPSFKKNHPKRRQARRIMIICNKRIPSDDLICSTTR